MEACGGDLVLGGEEKGCKIMNPFAEAVGNSNISEQKHLQYSIRCLIY